MQYTNQQHIKKQLKNAIKLLEVLEFLYTYKIVRKITWIEAIFVRSKLREQNFVKSKVTASAIQKICHSINGLNPLCYLTGLSGIGGRSLTRVGPIADKIERLPDWTKDFKRQLLSIIFMDERIMWNSTLVTKRPKLLPFGQTITN